jgi:hypothetical protein
MEPLQGPGKKEIPLQKSTFPKGPRTMRLESYEEALTNLPQLSSREYPEDKLNEDYQQPVQAEIAKSILWEHKWSYRLQTIQTDAFTYMCAN